MRCSCYALAAAFLAGSGLPLPTTRAQDASDDASQDAAPAEDETREEFLERRLGELEQRVRDLERRAARTPSARDLQRQIQDEIERGYARGIVTLGGAELRLGGKLEINFVDTENEEDPIFGGPTDNPDPHLLFDRLRLEPVIDVGRGLEVAGQIDLVPEDGSSLLKEGYASYRFRADEFWEDIWWLRSSVQIGLDDRFIHIGPAARVTESYPLIGSAFWREEEIGIIWEARLGAKRGAPEPPATPTPPRRARAPAAGAPASAVDQPPAAMERVSRAAMTDSTSYEPFDFAANPGALTFHASAGNGYTLNGESINKDGAGFNDIAVDNRETENGLALREVGLGVTYERDFNWLGELGATVYYFDDQLNEDSVEFLQQEMTERDGLGAVISGYGDSDKDHRSRFGVRVQYHLEGYHLLNRFLNVDTWPGDGLYASFEWIDAQDGDLGRDGWYVQGSYRISAARPLVGDRYFRYLEPVVRYDNYEVRLAPSVALPLTWDRRQFVAGAVIGVSQRILLKAEYAFQRESTGDGHVNNNELLMQVLIEF